VPKPFRQPVSDEKEIPEYAKEVSGDEEGIPSYAKEVTQKKTEPSIYKKVFGHEPSEPFKAGGPGYSYGTNKEKPQEIDRTKWDKRSDGSNKGDGFLGVFKLPNGSVASEYSIADSEKLKDSKGDYIDYPSLVPTLTKEEVQHTLNAAHKGTELLQSVKDKAEAHALKRKQQGLPLFATPGEERTDIHPDLERVQSYDSNKKREPFDTSPLGWRSALKWATSPLTEAPSRFAESVSRYINPESQTKGIRGVGSAFVEGLGQAASDLTAPANLALTAAPPGVARAAGAAMVGHGAYRTGKGIYEGNPEEAISGAVEGGVGFLGSRGHVTPSAKTEISVRQGREIPYRMGGAVKEAPKDIELPRETPPAAKPTEQTTKPAEAAPKKGIKNPFEKKAEEQTGNVPADLVPVGGEAEFNRSQIQPVERRASSEPPRYTPEDIASAKIESERLIRNPPIRAGASRPREPKIPKGSDYEIPEYAKEISPAAEESVSKPSIEESRTPGDFQLNNAAKSSPESLKKLNEFMDSIPKEGEQSVEQLKAGIGEVPPVKMPAAAEEPSVIQVRQTPTSSHGPTEEYHNQQKYDLRFASDAQDAASKSRARGMKNWAAKKAEEAKGPEAVKAPELAKPAEAAKPTEQTPELRGHDQPSLAERATSRLQDAREAAKERISKRGTFKGGRLLSGLPVDDLADFAVIGASHIAEGAIKFADWSTRMIKDFGDEIKPHLQKIFAAAQQQHTGNSVKELLNSLIESKGMNAEQQALYKTQRASRFKQFESAGGEGVDWAKKAMSTLKGEYEKVNPGEGLGLTPHESNSLFSAVKAAPISTPEKARGISTLFKLMNGESNLQTNEIDLLDKIFEKHFAKESGPGAAMPYDVKSGGKPISFAEAVSKKPDDFLTKLANFSSKSTRSVLGFHVPGTAISFHGFNEAIRNTVFGPDFNPFKAAGRFGQAAYYLAKPAKAAEFLDVNAEGLSRAIEEGGLKASTGDIGESGMFKGDNFITKGINALTSPKPLFGQVIPALKLKSYNGLLESIEKTGVPHDKAAKLAGYATNNIFGGLNLHELQRSQNTQKLFRAAALAPDWLESNVRLGKRMFDAIKNPKAPESKIYLVGMANFLGSYVALNVLNAINNNGRFAFQNEVGHEFDVAVGKDSAGRTRYFSPYGTAMDMFRIPLEIAHAAVEGNTGKLFSDARSRASEPLQFMTDLMTNTDYAGRSLYDKTKFGKHIPALTQGANIAGDVASHFLPIGVDAGVNLAQGKVSPEQFAAQVLQVPLKYKLPARRPGSLRLGNMKSLKP
jgi:hypothetical protein